MSSTHKNRDQGIDITNLTSKQKATIYGGALIFILLCAGGISTWLWIGPALGWWGATIAPVVPVDPLDTDEISLDVYWEHAHTERVDTEDHNLGLYGVDVSLMTEDEKDDLIWSDYSLKATYTDGDTPKLDEDFRYYVKLYGDNICTEYRVVVPHAAYVFYAVNLTADVAMTAFSTDEGSVTINQTNYDEWDILVKCLDGAEGTGVLTDSLGFNPFIPATNSIFEGLGNYTIIRIDTNKTSTSATYFSYLSYDADYVIEVPSGQYVYFCTPRMLYGEDTFQIKAGSLLGVVGGFEIEGISIGYGTADSFTAWDTQN